MLLFLKEFSIKSVLYDVLSLTYASASNATEKDGKATEYSANISVKKQYENEDKTQSTETVALGLYFTGADDNDKPNLESVLDDWGDFMPNYYSGTFDFKG